jgi:major membrane immunogen (membrane-anchored lipoprotein)
MKHTDRAYLIARYCLIVPALLAVTLALPGCSRQEAGLDGLQDGSYFGVGEFTDGNGWAPFLQIEVSDGRIHSAVFDYVNPSNEFKSRDFEYNRRMMAASGSSPEQFSPQLAQSLVDNQSLPVQAVTGATSSSRWFNELATAVVERSRAADTRVALVPMSSIYRAADEPDERGWVATIAIRYERQSIAEIEYDEVQYENGRIAARKSADSAYAENWRATSGIDQTSVYHQLTDQLIAEGRASGVDIISGATATSRRFRIVAQAAMDKRRPVDFQSLRASLQ